MAEADERGQCGDGVLRKASRPGEVVLNSDKGRE